MPSGRFGASFPHSQIGDPSEASKKCLSLIGVVAQNNALAGGWQEDG